MSMPIRTSPMIKVDTPVSDQRSVSPAKNVEHANAHSLNTPYRPALLHNNNAQGLSNPALAGNATLGQLFDMLEGIFKAIREMFSGKNSAPDATPDMTKLPKPLDTGKLPTPPEAGKLPAKLDVDKQPIVQDAGKTPPKPELTDVKSLVRDLHNQPLTPAPAPKPHVSVTRDDKTNVEVKVTVNHCHCPEQKVSPGNDVQPKIMPDEPTVPGVLPKLNDDNAPKVVPAPWPHPRLLPEIKPQSPVLPDRNPTPSPDLKPKPSPDLKPIPSPDLKPTPAPDLKPTPSPDLKPTPLPDAPVPDLTSPDPSQSLNKRKNHNFTHRPAFKL